MTYCFVFDTDGTVEWGGGPISTLQLHTLQQQGHHLCGGASRDPTTQQAEFSSQGIPLDAVPQHNPQQLRDVRALFPADRYVFIGATTECEDAAAQAGYEYCPASIFMLNFAPLFTGTP